MACAFRICRVVTVPLTFATLLREQIRRVVEAGFEVTLVSSPGPQLAEVACEAGARSYDLPMAREVSPFADLAALRELVRYLRRERFDLVHSSTPKAGLLVAMAGLLARIPRRLHTYTGQPWVELQGPMRWAAITSDRTVGRLDTHLYADSESQRRFLVAHDIVPEPRIRVLGDGSISGVDLRRFDPEAWQRESQLNRAELGIDHQAIVIAFVGRVTRDKGIRELVVAFNQLASERTDMHLMLVGPQEPERDPLPPETQREIVTNRRIHTVGFTDKPERYLALADVFCLPSYREGFGTVAIEAGAMRLPSVVSRITGLIDAIVDEQTGIVVPPKQVAPLAHALGRLIADPDLRRRMGAAARDRAMRCFDADVVNGLVVSEYARLLQPNR
jgi:glycosyltransferase involved in cell wall biosynthesis